MVIGTRPEVLAVVQARGGSKSLPGKNIRLLAGHPLIAYSIAAGRAAKTVTRVIVSTDSQEIKKVSLQYGAEVPFLRPTELATDDSPDLPLFMHALQWLDEKEQYRPDIVVQLRPTSPFRPAGLIDCGVERLLSNPEADSVRTVTQPNQNPYKMWREASGGFLQPVMTGDFLEPYNMPRQQLPQVWWQTGHLDVIHYKTILAGNSLTGKSVLPLVVDRNYCVDIDTEADWKYAESLFGNAFLAIIKPSVKAAVNSERGLSLLAKLRLLVMDFDGVLTDNRVWTTSEGKEAVVCSRSDGMGLAMLREHGVVALVLSSEVNPVVAARCSKLGIPCRQGIKNKGEAFLALAQEFGVDVRQAAFVGNDVNDLECLRIAGCGIAVADAHTAVLQQADWILKTPGGQGAIREVCDRIIETKNREGTV